MRVNKPSLVVPELAHERIFAQDMGITTARTIGRRTSEVASEKEQGGKPPILAGAFADGSAATNLARLLHEQGLIIDQTEAGSPQTQPVGFTNFSIGTIVAPVTPSTTSTTYADIYSRSITIGYGIWFTYVFAEASFTNSGATLTNVRLWDGATQWDLASMGVTVARERYAVSGAQSLGPGTYTWTMQYRIDPSATGPTATARAPWMLIAWTRTA